jgi:hypothetical protein
MGSSARSSKRSRFQPAIGIADSEHYVFVGRGADNVGPPTDLDEADEVSWVPQERLLTMVNEGTIRDGREPGWRSASARLKT